MLIMVVLIVIMMLKLKYTKVITLTVMKILMNIMKPILKEKKIYDLKANLKNYLQLTMNGDMVSVMDETSRTFIKTVFIKYLECMIYFG